jgi:hypothetical protein
VNAPNPTNLRVEVVDDSEYADEMAVLEALRDEAIHTFAAWGDDKSADELLAGWEKIGRPA